MFSISKTNKLTINQIFSISKKAFNQDIFKQLSKHLTNNQPNIFYKQKKTN